MQLFLHSSAVSVYREVRRLLQMAAQPLRIHYSIQSMLYRKLNLNHIGFSAGSFCINPGGRIPLRRIETRIWPALFKLCRTVAVSVPAQAKRRRPAAYRPGKQLNKPPMSRFSEHRSGTGQPDIKVRVICMQKGGTGLPDVCRRGAGSGLRYRSPPHAHGHK